ncbi:MAG TPA: hypothetical protein VLE51_00785 [Candidatus Saccharimonadales bacterium]|nr:hypothetical protein [Candidatus Saccharimonadales bacterium]
MSHNFADDSQFIWNDIQKFVDFLAIGVGVVVVGAIILGGIQYAASGDNPNGIQSAKQRITNALIALFAFIFVYAFIKWLIPGQGVF